VSLLFTYVPALCRCGKRGHLQTVYQGELAKQANKLQRDQPLSVKHMEEEQVDSDNGDDEFALWTVFGNHKKGTLFLCELITSIYRWNWIRGGSISCVRTRVESVVLYEVI